MSGNNFLPITIDDMDIIDMLLVYIYTSVKRMKFLKKGFAGLELLVLVAIISGLASGVTLIQKKNSQNIDSKARYLEDIIPIDILLSWKIPRVICQQILKNKFPTKV
jgi:hypothetical protein